ncbi:MAG: hypothetical protein HY422_00100 [Candidatus Komeilibacteria bacterium]|nr:hypothetical protein [Candidatus Komeilibacteria bacterium]
MKLIINWHDMVMVKLTPKGREYFGAFHPPEPIDRSGRVEMSFFRLMVIFGRGLTEGPLWSPFVGGIHLDVPPPKKRRKPSNPRRRRPK